MLASFQYHLITSKFQDIRCSGFLNNLVKYHKNLTNYFIEISNKIIVLDKILL